MAGSTQAQKFAAIAPGDNELNRKHGPLPEVITSHEPSQGSLPSLIEVAAFPALFVVGFLSSAIWPLHLAVFLLCTTSMHELGHAVNLWLGGQVAVPCFMFGFTVPLTQHRSAIVTLVYAAAVLAIQIYAGKRRWWFLQVGAATTLFVLLLFSFILNDRNYEMLVVYGGLGGELYLSTLLIVFFHHSRKLGAAWNSKRLLLLVVGTLSVTSSLQGWWNIYFNHAPLPMGSMWGAFGGADGDLERLRDQFGWTAEKTISVYSAIASGCATVLFADYLSVFYRYHRRRGTAD